MTDLEILQALETLQAAEKMLAGSYITGSFIKVDELIDEEEVDND